jgi:hypothetical protein
MLWKGNFPSCTNLKISIACPFSQHQKVCQEHLEKLQLLKLLPSGQLLSCLYFHQERRIGVETRLKGYKYFEIERDFLNKLGVLIDGDFKFDVLLLVFVRFLVNTLIKINYSLSTFRRCQDSRERGKGD